MAGPIPILKIGPTLLATIQLELHDTVVDAFQGDVLEEIDEVNTIAAPGFTKVEDYEALLSHCEKLKDRIAILDAPPDVDNVDLLTRVGTAPPPAKAAKPAAADQGAAPPSKPQGLHRTAESMFLPIERPHNSPRLPPFGYGVASSGF